MFACAALVTVFAQEGVASTELRVLDATGAQRTNITTVGGVVQFNGTWNSPSSDPPLELVYTNRVEHTRGVVSRGDLSWYRSFIGIADAPPGSICTLTPVFFGNDSGPTPVLTIYQRLHYHDPATGQTRIGPGWSESFYFDQPSPSPPSRVQSVPQWMDPQVPPFADDASYFVKFPDYEWNRPWWEKASLRVACYM